MPGLTPYAPPGRRRQRRADLSGLGRAFCKFACARAGARASSPCMARMAMLPTTHTGRAPGTDHGNGKATALSTDRHRFSQIENGTLGQRIVVQLRTRSDRLSAVCVPSGTPESSPALQCRESVAHPPSRPVGTTEPGRTVRNGGARSQPAQKGWSTGFQPVHGQDGHAMTRPGQAPSKARPAASKPYPFHWQLAAINYPLPCIVRRHNSALTSCFLVR